MSKKQAQLSKETAKKALNLLKGLHDQEIKNFSKKISQKSSEKTEKPSQKKTSEK